MTSEGLVADLCVRRGDFLLDIALSIEPGCTIALLGPNGAGKSTTVNVLAGLDENGHDDDSVKASVRLGGRVLDDSTTGQHVPAEHRRVGVVFQDHLLFDHLSVLDNVAFGPRSVGSSRSEARRSARIWLETLGIAELAARQPVELSGGQAQRVAIARTLASEPEMLLFDEPLAALDVSSRVDLRRVLRRHLDDFAGPRLLITHDPTDAFVLADRVVVIEDGAITQVGSPDEIRRRPVTPYVAALAGTNLFGGEALDGIVRLDEHDWTLTVADTTVAGQVLVTVSPAAISLHPNRPDGSQRNTWESSVDLVEPLGDTVRITLGGPLPMSVDVTPGAVSALELAPGATVWAAVKATEIAVSAA